MVNRAFTQTPLAQYPRKDSQDKDSIDATPTEYSKSGTDADSAHSSTAFDPSQTKPETEKNSSEVGFTLPLAPFFGQSLEEGTEESNVMIEVEDVEASRKAQKANFGALKGSDLDVSPANPEVSKQRGQTEGGAENSPSEGKRSGGGGQEKNGKI
jgi:hypothetical protein